MYNKVFKEWYNNYYKPVRDKFPNRVAGQLKRYGYDPYNASDIRQFVKNNTKWKKKKHVLYASKMSMFPK